MFNNHALLNIDYVGISLIV